MASSETFDVILRLLMDDAALGRIKSGASSVADEFEKVDKKTEEVTKEIQKQEKIAIAAMKQEAGAIRKVAALRAKELGELKERAAWIDSAAKPMFAVGIAGIASITALAKKYVDTTEESNEVTQAWAASTEKVNAAQMRIGKIAAEAVLPLYEKLATIAEKGADFVEKNPGVIENGLKASIVLAGLGGLGMLVAKGLRLYADVQMIAVGDMQLLAAKMMTDAATKQLAAAGGGSGAAKGFGIGETVKKAAPTAAGGAATAGSLSGAAISGIVVGLIAGQTALSSLGQAAGKAAGLTEQTTDTILTLSSAGIYPLFKSLGQWINVQTGLTAATDANTAATANATATMAQSGANASKTLTQTAGAMNQAAGAANNAAASSRGLASGLGGIGSSIADFIGRIISSFGGGSTPPVHDYTGYAYSRTYRMAQDGKRQFVMSGDMTRIAEQMLGGQLNQQMVLSAMGGGNSRVVWQDQRRFSGEYTKAMRNAQRADTLEIFDRVGKQIGRGK